MVQWIDNSFDHILSESYGVHKTLLDFVKNDNSNSQKNAHEDKAIYEPAPANEFACTEKSKFECLKDWGYRVEAH